MNAYVAAILAGTRLAKIGSSSVEVAEFETNSVTNTTNAVTHKTMSVSQALNSAQKPPDSNFQTEPIGPSDLLTIDNTVHSGYATSPYTPIWSEAVQRRLEALVCARDCRMLLCARDFE